MPLLRGVRYRRREYGATRYSGQREGGRVRAKRRSVELRWLRYCAAYPPTRLLCDVRYCRRACCCPTRARYAVSGTGIPVGDAVLPYSVRSCDTPGYRATLHSVLKAAVLRGVRY
eukprot:118938-Rhodomonas_salina.4